MMKRNREAILLFPPNIHCPQDCFCLCLCFVFAFVFFFEFVEDEEEEQRGHIAIPTHHPLPPRPFGGITFTAQTDLVLPHRPSSYYFSAEMRMPLTISVCCFIAILRHTGNMPITITSKKHCTESNTYSFLVCPVWGHQKPDKEKQKEHNK